MNKQSKGTAGLRSKSISKGIDLLSFLNVIELGSDNQMSLDATLIIVLVMLLVSFSAEVKALALTVRWFGGP